jgi:lipopolysaccharide export system protein LptA
MSLLFFIFSIANFQSDKMEILNTDEGRITVFKGNVVITEEHTRITAQTAAFHQTKGFAVVSDTVVIRTEQATITADTAYYYLDAERTVLKGHPKIFHESQVISADTLVFDHRTGQAFTDMTVLITDSTKNLTIQGRKAEYNLKTEIAHLRADPVLTIKKDSVITVTSQRMDLMGKDGLAQAVGTVLLTSGKTLLKCDSLVYYYNKNTGQAFGSPKIEEGANSATSDTVRFYTEKEALTRVDLEDNARGEYWTDDGDKVEVEGKRITIFFNDNKVERLEVDRPTLGNLYRHKKTE